MKKIYFLQLVLGLIISFGLSAQTTLLGPTGDGGFEAAVPTGTPGPDFLANGWTVVNGANNQFFVGTTAVPSAGTYSSYTGTSSSSWVGQAFSTVNHFYRDITIPAGENIATISFKYKVSAVDATFDYLKVFIVPTTTVPIAGTQLTSGQVGVTAGYDGTTGYLTYSISAPVAAGTTQRLVFSFRTDAASPYAAAAIDEISLSTRPLTSITSTTLGGLWSSPETWIGGVIPGGDDVTISNGAIVTIDQAVSVRDLTIGQGTSGILQWNSTSHIATVSGNVLVNQGANFNLYTAAASPAGTTLNIGGNFTNNGTVYAAYALHLMNFTNTSASGASVLGGTGTFVGGIISQLFAQSTGGVNINTSQNITTRSLAVTAGTLNTNGKLTLDNTALLSGQTFSQAIYSVVVTNMGSGYNSATPPTVTLTAPTGFGVVATAVAVIDDVNGTLRAIKITNAGDGYRANATVTITGGTGTGATAVAVNNRISSGFTASTIQKSGIASISGGLPIKSDQSVGSVGTSNAGIGYTSAPEVGFALPTGFLNLVKSGGSGYTTAPTVTVTGGTTLAGFTPPTFTVVVSQGIVVSVIASGGGTLWTSLPTLTLTGGGGSGATCEYPVGSLATATATITNEAVSNITVTNGGFGYTAAPAVGLVGGGFTTAATTPFSAVALYNLVLGYFSPAASNAMHTETGVVPANRRINAITMNSASGATFAGNIELYASAPITLTSGLLDMGVNTLLFSYPTYAGVAGTLTSSVSGVVQLSTPGGSLTRTFPFDAAVAAATGTGSLATGSTVTSLTAYRTTAPSGTVSPSGNVTGTRAYRIVANAGSVYGINPTVTLNYNSNDALVSDAPSLFVAQSATLTGPWTVRSIASGSGALPATGSKTTATAAPGPIVPTGDDFYAFTTTYVPPITSVTSGNWNSGATWSTGIVPTCGDNIQINATHNVTVTTAGNVSKQLTIATGGTLTVSSGDLTVGCTLNNSSLSNNGTLTITGGTVWVNGNVALNSPSTYNMSGGNLNIDPNDGTTAGSVASGSSTFAIGSSSAAMTSNVTGGSILINDAPFTGNGYSVVMNTNTNASWAGSTIQFGGTTNLNSSTATNGFRVDCYFNSGRLAFGHVIINGNDATKPVTDVSFGINATGNLVVNAGSELRIATSLSSFAGNILNNGTITATSAVSLQLITGLSNIPAAVPNAQLISGSGIFRNLLVNPTAELNGLLVNNSSSAGVTIGLLLRISGTLTLTAGFVNTTSTNLLTVGVSGTTLGTIARTAGMVNGPLKKWYNAATGTATFPLTDGVNYKPATINFTTAPTTAGTLTANFSSADPNFPNAAPLIEGAIIVNQASRQGSWFITEADGLTGGNYTGTFTGNGSTDVIDYTKTVLIKRPAAGGDWVLDGVHVTSTGTNTAPVVSRTGMTGFTAEFAIGGEGSVALPMTIEYFKGSKQSNGHLLDWKVTCYNSASVTMLLERSANGRNFDEINSQSETAARCLQPFSYRDLSPLSGINYYRLKSIDVDGKVSYSTTVALLNLEKGFEIVSMAPNPVNTTAVLSVSSATKSSIEIVVTALNGQQILKQKMTLIAGNNLLPLNVRNLPAGTYQVTGITSDGMNKTLRFVKD